MKTFSQSPYRTPLVVADAIKGIIKDKVVCELGCGEGDLMVAMSKYAKKVFGIEIDPERYKHALGRGFEISVTDYRKQDIPLAEVYYFWPDNGFRDNEFLVQKIISNESFKGTILIGGDRGHQLNTEAYNIPKKPEEQREPNVLSNLAKKYNAQIMEIEFNEGEGYRQNGTFLVCIIKND